MFWLTVRQGWGAVPSYLAFLIYSGPQSVN